MNRIKLIILSLLVVFISFSLFTLLRLPYERILDRALRSLERGGVKISYKEVKLEPVKLKATFSDANIGTNMFNLKVKSLEGEIPLKELLLGFKIKVNLRFSSGDIILPALPGVNIPFNEGRATLERGSNSLKVSGLFIRGNEILVTGDIDGKRYNLRIKPSGGVEKSLSPFLRLLQRDKDGFYNLRSEI